jgi:flagellar biogenesis protein FliO
VTITSIVEVDNARRLLAVGVQVNYDIQWSSAREEVTKKLNDVIATHSFDKMLQSITGTAVTATAIPEVVNIDPTSMPTFMPTVSTQTKGGALLGTTAIIVIVVVVGGFFLLLGLSLFLCYYFRRASNNYVAPLDIIDVKPSDDIPSAI